jgi:hypothetical protein
MNPTACGCYKTDQLLTGYRAITVTAATAKLPGFWEKPGYLWDSGKDSNFAISIFYL